MSDGGFFRTYYGYDEQKLKKISPYPLDVVEGDIDLYYRIALDLYGFIEERATEGGVANVILPVGPVFQYRRFREILQKRPLDLSGLNCFFMDEYLSSEGTLIPAEHPLSFRGFIEREFLTPLEQAGALRREQVRFPDPKQPLRYDEELEALGGAGLCQAGVGINGHLAFNEAAEMGENGKARMSTEEFSALSTRVVELSAETRITNSHTALSGAYEYMPRRAVTIGMASILKSEHVRVYMNRPWQRSVVRKALCEEVSAAFPVTLLRAHPDVACIVTSDVISLPAFFLA